MAVRVALATNIISPYRVPLYSALGSTPRWKFNLFSCCEMEFDRQWMPAVNLPFSHKRSFSLSYKRSTAHRGHVSFTGKSQVHVPLGLWLDLWRFEPDIIISDEMGARTLIAATYAFLARKRLAIWFYGTPHTERDINWRKRLLRKVLVRRANAFVGMGIEARRYLQSLGVPGEAIFDAPNAIELRFQPTDLSPKARFETRQKLGISGLCYLYTGALIARKGVGELLEAWETFSRDANVDVSLVLVGDGPAKESLARRVTQRGLRGVKFIPFVQPHALSPFYHEADVLVFPTLEDQ